jgi:hypothetical protein
VRLSQQQLTLRAGQFAGGLAALVALLAGVTLAASVAELHRRQDFVRVIHGASRLRAMFLPTLAVALMGAMTLGVAIARHTFLGALGAVFAGAVLAADLLAVILLLAFQLHRLHADTIENS